MFFTPFLDGEAVPIMLEIVIMYVNISQADKTQKKNGEIRVEILTKIKSGKAHIFTIFISISLSTVINASTIYA
jgi:hypothetical protein